jgi:hypothetical protein
MDATVWRWVLGLSTTRMAGGFLEEYKILKRITYIIFADLFLYTHCVTHEM